MMISNLFLVIDPVTAIAAASAIAGLVGSVYSSHMNRKSQRETNAMQLRAQQATNAFNAAEAQKERDWNDYSNQSDRMRAAGLNPSLMFGGQGSPVNSGAVASGTGVPGLTAPTYDFGQSQIGSLSEIAASINSLAQAGKAGADTKEILTLLKDRAREQAANADKSEFERNMARIDSEFYDQYGHELKRTELQLLKNQSNKTYEEMMLAIEQQDVAKAEAALKSVQKEHEEELKGLSHAQRFALEQRNERIEEYITWEIEQMKSSAASNYGSANLANTQAKWTPFNAQTNRISANASASQAALGWQEYNNPKDLEGAILRTIENDPEKAGEIIVDALDGAVKSVVDRLDAKAKKWMLETLEEDIQYREKYDPHPWSPIEKFMRRKKKEKIAALKQGKWR